MSGVYLTKISQYVAEDGTIYPAIQIPPELLEKLELVEGEILEWEISEDGKVSFQKSKIIVND